MSRVSTGFANILFDQEILNDLAQKLNTLPKSLLLLYELMTRINLKVKTPKLKVNLKLDIRGNIDIT